ncbi:MAG: DMT family transporter [Formivibrio sp.]|nr:DMT family transporter [Formivibrio sp.]
MTSRPIFLGVLCALAAGLLWGLVFVAPVILGDYPPAMLAFGRYLAFGVIALPLALRSRHRLASLERCDWWAALELSFVGNILYYLCLAAAIQLAGAPVPTMIIGTLPIVIAIASNMHEGILPWRKLVPSLGVIGLGILLVNQREAACLDGYGAGIVLAMLANACWTWYPIRNSRWLKRRPQISSDIWATAQGLATLPLALLGMVLSGLWFASRGHFDFPLGSRPAVYVGMMLSIGFLASWLGTLLWNRASQLLPTALAGQLIVFETLAALGYAFLWRGYAPGLPTLAGIALLVLGVMLGVRVFRVVKPVPER